MRGLVSRSWTRVDHDLDDHDGTDMESRLQINKPRALARLGTKRLNLRLSDCPLDFSPIRRTPSLRRRRRRED